MTKGFQLQIIMKTFAVIEDKKDILTIDKEGL